MEFGGRKRERKEGASTDNGAFKKSKDEMESFTTGVGSKSKPCMRFYSTSGCQFGDGCHFLHHVPGYNAFSHLSTVGRNAAMPVGRNMPFSDGPASTAKTKICNRFTTPEGCKFGDKCHFAHGDMALGKSRVPGYEDQRGMASVSRYSGQVEQSSSYRGAAAATASFGTSATAKISIDASHAGAVIGKNGGNSRQICRVTGVKLSIKDHQSDPRQRNIELEGTFDQIKEASAMVRELIVKIGVGGSSFDRAPSGRQFKTKTCENFLNGNCSFGVRCHFAHSASELRK